MAAADRSGPSVISPGPAAGARWAGYGDATFPEHLPTVAGLLADASRRHPRNLAVATPDARLTYEELDERSALLAALLVGRGIGKGAVVGILLPNGVEWVVSWAAVTRIGAIAAPVNTFYKTPEMAAMLRHADVRVLIACTSFGPHDYTERLAGIAPELRDPGRRGPLFLPSLPQLRHVLVWDQSPHVPWAEPITGHHPPSPDITAVAAVMQDDVVPADPMLITYTSGSTGEPKGVVHGHGPLLRHARNLAAMSGLGPQDRIWTPMPLCWVGGFSFTLLRALSVGAAFVTQETMDAGVALQLLERERVTCASAWPSIGATLTAHPGYARADLSALRLGALYEARAPEHRPANPALSVTSLGMSETGGPHTFWTAAEDRLGAPEEFCGTFGHEIPGMSHRVIDAEGNDVAEGAEGQVLVRGYSLMLGLHKRERHQVFDADGWYHTGDRGYFIAGWFFFSGRSTDLIKTKGANVSPMEVEAVLCEQEGVRQAYVFGADHDLHGQEVVAIVVPDDGAAEFASAEVLLPRLRERLSSYKIPRHIFSVDASEIPYLTSQKADRRALADLAVRLRARARPA